jgi:hypothetical protein
MLLVSWRVTSERMMQIEIFKKNIMIHRRSQKNSTCLRQRWEILARWIRNRRKIVNVAYANSFRHVDNSYSQCQHTYIDRRKVHFSILCIDFIIDVKTHFRVVVKSVQQMKVALIKTQRCRDEGISSRFLNCNNVVVLCIEID